MLHYLSAEMANSQSLSGSGQMTANNPGREAKKIADSIVDRDKTPISRGGPE